MSWKVTVLCENTVPVPGLLGEHGFAAYVETPTATLLFDTGQGFGLVPNSLRLKKDLAKVDKLVLSHGHFDHTGGMLAFLGVHGPCQVVAHPDVLLERFRWMPVGPDQKPVSIGMPWKEAYLTTRGARFQWVEDFREIVPNVFVSGQVPRRTDFETGDPKFVIRDGDGWTADPFRDDYSLVLKTPKGLVVILGCAHAGLINILEHVTRQCGEDRIYAVLGGTHLGFSPSEQLDKTLEELKRYQVQILAVSHCTGQAPIARLSAEFGPHFAFAPVGYTLAVED
ncbi:7,8-dihydropterin-6-yl-methyl-4-(beta-D-ribofuranosyl)aminobenzene 5'-phosphate synthase [Desulfacinum hydrothermale DSM 13146]|uniref:7,8-dihydropterin-6-yl-methyl-4-(Beta-D-ribofuranosyl)aminobenzene 5'-phosphate synthase n=1 Tax=Desulfacinum hydrothermale DSM 13146 TaxID=1121390 RepID=A0A1W1XRU8_9BACT|nr:MBL fold metallo-hydrolase [Desulfacinum hydrothermale]SMC26617.1 7,8-dihydropterin-6-yl-methyl-4-(beta-D-ribofuranosyl)aminobenzene 5'-phosphate synthase [Desulfacinum hydrothermale DSM 13146]